MSTFAERTLGRYRLLSLLGAGGMGEVYRALDTELGREVAVKVLPPDFANDPERLRRFEIEARAAAAISHPNILAIHDVGRSDGTSYLVTELLEGETLRHRIRSGGLTVATAVGYAIQAAHGLAAAHAKGVLHRDLKTENLFLTTDGRIKILDFGLAKLAPAEEALDQSAETATGAALGTVGYMAPEVLRGQPADARSDLFSIGAVLYEMVCGRRPFSGGTPAETVAQALQSDPAPMPREVPAPLQRIVRRCLEKRPEDRFQSAHDLALALEALHELPARAVAPAGAGEPRPYPGLASFTEADAEYFFGREAEVEELWRRIPSRRLLAVIGPSGAGKSSFLRAGVLPAAPGGWSILVCQPGEAPFASLARALVPAFMGDAETTGQLFRLREPEVAVEVVRKWRRRRDEALLVVDQLEELFTLNPPEIQAKFAALLGRLADEADVHVVLAIRDDFFFECSAHPSLVPVFENAMPLRPPAGEALRRAVVKPAQKHGFAFSDDGLVNEMLTAVEGERGALPMLAFTLARLWEQRDRGRKLLTREAYDQLGGVGGALAQHAEATLARIGDERLPIVRELFRNLVTAQGTRAVRDVDELLSVFGSEARSPSSRASKAPARGDPSTRSLRSLAQDDRGGVTQDDRGRGVAQDDRRGAAEEVLRELVDARLLTSYEVHEEDHEPTHRVEIIHESLLAVWPRLVRWQTRDADAARLRDELRQAARAWGEHNRTDDLLWTGATYREFAVWREHYPGRLSELEEAYAHAMTAHAKRRRRRRRIAAAAVLLASMTVGVVTTTLWRRSVHETRRAEAAARQQEAAKLLALGHLHLEDHPNGALAFAIASLERADNEPARRFAVEALWQGPPALFLSGPLSPIGVLWSPDGRWLALDQRARQGIVVLDRDSVDQSFIPGSELPVDFTPDSRQLVAVPWEPPRNLRLWDLPEARLSRTVELPQPSWFLRASGSRVVIFEGNGLTLGGDHAVAVHRVALDGKTREFLGTWRVRGFVGLDIDPTGSWIASVQQGRVLQQQLDDLSAPPRVLGRHEGETDLWVHPWRDRLVTADSQGEIRIWNVAEGRVERVLKSPADARKVTLDPQGRFLAAGPGGSLLSQGSLSLFDLRAPPSASPVPLLDSDMQSLTAWQFSPDGSWLASAHSGLGALWNLQGQRPIVLGTRQGSGLNVAFTAEGRLVSTSGAGVVRVWPLSPAADGGVRELWWCPGGTRRAGSLAVDPRGRFVVVAEAITDNLHILPLDGSRPSLHRFKGTPGLEHWVFAPVVDPSGRYVAVGYMERQNSAAHSIRVLDLETGDERVLDTHPQGEERCKAEGPTFQACWMSVWLADGRLVSDGDAGLRLWDLEAGTSKRLRPCTELRWMLGLLATPNSQYFLRLRGAEKTGDVSTLTVFDLSTKGVREITSHGNRVSAMALDPSGSILVTGSMDGVVRVGPLTGEEPFLLYGHSERVTSVAVSPDGAWIASGSQDGTIRLWPMPDLTKPPLHTLPYDELLAKLKSLTNLRAVPDPVLRQRLEARGRPVPGLEDGADMEPVIAG